MKPNLYAYEVEDLRRDVDTLRVLAGALDVLGAREAADQLRGTQLRIRSVLPRLEFEINADKANAPATVTTVEALSQ